MFPSHAAAPDWPQLRRRLIAGVFFFGLRVLPGGDYGFAWDPNGTTARDFEHFINLFDYTSNEVLSAATQLGGHIMDMGDELGLVNEAYLADLLLIDGNPVQEVTLLQARENLLMMMKDGEYHQPPRPRKPA